MKTNVKYAAAMAAALAGLGMSAPAFGQTSMTNSQEPPKLERKVPMKQARRTALRAVPGSITSGELEYENEMWVYSFDIAGKDGKTHEVQIDAKTGAIADQKIETPADEAAEKKADMQKKAPDSNP